MKDDQSQYGRLFHYEMWHVESRDKSLIFAARNASDEFIPTAAVTTAQLTLNISAEIRNAH